MVTGILLYLAFIRLLHSDYHIEAGAMLLTASIAVCANLLYVPVWSGRLGGLRARRGPPLGWESWQHKCSPQQSALGMPEKGLGEGPTIQGQRTVVKCLLCVPSTLAGAFIVLSQLKLTTTPMR